MKDFIRSVRWIVLESKMKDLFRFVRRVAKTDDPMDTILIILGVIAFIVCLWISFATLF